MRAKVTVLVRAVCPACDEMRSQVERICAQLGLSWSTTDVDTDAELSAEYGDRVPVVLIGGVEHASGRLDERRFRCALG